MNGPLVVVGDALLDRDVQGRVERLSPDAPVPVLDEAQSRARPGGAALAAALAARDGLEVTLVTALARDEAAAELRAELERAGVEIVDLGLAGSTPEKIRFRSDDRSLMRLDRGGAGVVGPATAAARAAVGWASGVLVADYGRGVAAERGLREALAAVAPHVPLVWDPHPNGPPPTAAVTVATPNEREVDRIEREPGGGGLAGVTERALALRRRWEAWSVCVTRGARGAVLVRGDGPPLAVPAPEVAGGDPCGAGDRFASRLVAGLATGATLEQGVVDAVDCASTFVAAGGAARALLDRPAVDVAGDGLDRVESVRSGGGTVVATGGCFDLLHAGHVRTLEAARRLGDCLVVCLNSDESVRRLKGPDRPLVPQDDRASVLAALACVDAVVVFGEDTPERVLARLRPHVWAKGGDYDGVELPEDRVLRAWGGRSVLLPYVEGRSTTRLIAEASARA
jgi:D-beta-D-heptose 7-phosphate kinase / D-beta-D-heptose 1-phosphate adenosyltransferase